jgi:RND family efflux transporter MFP subunit
MRRTNWGFGPSLALQLASAMLALGACSLGACSKKAPPPAPPPLVMTAHPLQQPVIDWDDFVGRFEAVDSVDMRPRVSGYLDKIDFHDGDIVHKGQVLFEIDPRPYQAALDQARGVEAHDEAALNDATTERKRAEGLFDARAVSQQELTTRIDTEQQARADLLSAQAAVRTAELNLGWTKVTAPITGRVSDRRVAPGNLVAADQTILTNIVDLDPIRFTFVGPESIYLKYERANEAGTRISSRRMANPVLIRLQDETTYRWRGRMDFVDNQIDTQSGAIRGRAVVPNPNHILTPGLFGHLRLLGSGTYAALLVPDAAVVTDQTRQVVYVVNPQGLVSERLVTIGTLVGDMRVIRQGLKPEDVVIVDGLTRARPGQKVRTREAQLYSAGQSPTGQPSVIEPVASIALPANAR